MLRNLHLVVAAAMTTWCGGVAAQVAPYDPYAEFQESPPAVLPDGTLHWGTFFKSAALEQNYRRLWNLGACRGSNKAITVPVERNKVLIDRLPEQVFHGVVRHAAGTNAGGVIAFSNRDEDFGDAPVFFAQLHPSGATPVVVSGRSSPEFLASGMTVRLRATCDDRGHVAEPPSLIEIVTMPPDFVPDPVRPGRRDMIVGQIVRVRSGSLHLSVPSGRVRRVTVPVGEETAVMVDATAVELAAPGDLVEVKGRLWDGAGAPGAGTVFAGRVTVTKPGLVEDAAATSAPGTIVADVAAP